VSDVLKALARVTSALPIGEERLGQEQMASAVDVAIRTKTHLAVQAGTGTGKTLAYLVPAILSGVSVIVATAT
jgi:ATP-dependent DNA helicase DinG